MRGLLRNTTDYVGATPYAVTTGFNTQMGYGRVNANTAVNGVGKAEIQVLDDDSVNIADGSGLIDFGTLITNTTATRTFRIRNQGTLDLNLSNLRCPPFKISTGLGSTTLKVGQTTTFSVSFTPTAGGLVNQSLSLTTNDADEGTFNFTVRGTGQAPSISGTVSTTPTATACSTAARAASAGGPSSSTTTTIRPSKTRPSPMSARWPSRTTTPPAPARR